MRLRTSRKCRTDNIRTEGVNEEITIPYTVKVHSLTSFCIKMYVDMACIVMYGNISIARSKRVN